MNGTPPVEPGRAYPSLHFTYCPPEAEDLRQGDILLKNEEIQSVLGEVHRHYLKEDYLRFIVLTQSCDLVRREGNQCRARYITLAAIRPLELVVQREIAKHQDAFAGAAMVCGRNSRPTLERFLARLFNNNETGYFYLHEAPEYGLLESSCAFLYLSVALKAELHYETCLRARTLSLMEVLQAKLGWLVGNIYSRVGTEDWVPRYRTEREFYQHIGDTLDASCQWVDDKRLKAASKAAKDQGIEADLVSKGWAIMREHIQSARVPSRREMILERVSAVVSEIVSSVDTDTLKRLRHRLASDPTFASWTK